MERTVPVPFSHRSPTCSSSPAQRLGLASELPRRIGQDELHGGLLRQGPKLALGGCGVRSGNNTTRHPHVAWGYKHFGKITPQNHLICCNQVAHLAHQALGLRVHHAFGWRQGGVLYQSHGSCAKGVNWSMMPFWSPISLRSCQEMLCLRGPTSFGVFNRFHVACEGDEPWQSSQNRSGAQK